MSKIVFVPLTDEMIFEHPEMITGPVTTYKPADSGMGNHSVGLQSSDNASSAYLIGDMVKGFDVVYVDGNLSQRAQD